MKILLTGATGLIGARLVQALSQNGFHQTVLSRRPRDSWPQNVDSLVGNPAVPGPWLDALDECDAVVHLAGENIFAKRWTTTFMEEIHTSRVVSTALIAERMAMKPFRSDGTPRILLSASAIGFYGPGEEPKDESSPAGSDFMARVCVDWEAEADVARRAGVRVVHPRFGIVLDPEGGALPNMMRPFRMFVGGPVGNGKQWVSWIHRDDVTAALVYLLTHPVSGPFNLTAPRPVRNREFTSILARVMHRPNWLPVPRLAIRLALGKVAEVATSGQQAIPNALSNAAFPFRYPELEGALRQLLAPAT
ncbi:MAG: TIGR01777 family oxidoreductase [Gemmataceae bacterium]